MIELWIQLISAMEKFFSFCEHYDRNDEQMSAVMRSIQKNNRPELIHNHLKETGFIFTDPVLIEGSFHAKIGKNNILYISTGNYQIRMELIQVQE